MVTLLAENVYWVGTVDWSLRHFHGHELSTHRGSSYNSYLIKDQKTALVDTVWGPFKDDFLEKVSSLIELSKIDYIVINHSEPDHSGALPALMRHIPQATVIVSKQGEKSVPGHYHQQWNFQPVGNGENISLGNNQLVFLEAPMLHWPDSMFTYLTGPNILMPNDAFGQHYATAFRFNDLVNQQELHQEALKYYANILTPFSKLVLKKIDEVLAMNIPVHMIAPSHGVIWRDNPLQIVTSYQKWAQQEPEQSAVILYDTMWEGTRTMAYAIAEGLAEKGIPHKLFHMAVSDRNDIITEIFKSRAIILGSPTLNKGLLPTMMPILEDIRGLSFQNKIGAAFGTYGWSGESVGIIEEHLNHSNIPLAAEGVKAKWQPDEDALHACRELGKNMAGEISKNEKTPKTTV